MVDGGALLRGEIRWGFGAALSAVCHIANEFSPLRPVRALSLSILEENDC